MTPKPMLPEPIHKEVMRARSVLDHPGIAVRLTSLLGGPLEKGMSKLPASARAKISKATTLALEKASWAALQTLDDEPGRGASSITHKLMAGASGAIGGAAGLAGLSIELPISTVVMVRSIADIARSEGESLSDPALGPEIMAVFALGGPSTQDDAAETGYYAVRNVLARTISEATAAIAAKGLSATEGPTLARLIAVIAARFEIQVTQKAAAQLVPVIGGIAGAAINTLFIDHFQDMARGHFIIRRLEREHGAEAVRNAYTA